MVAGLSIVVTIVALFGPVWFSDHVFHSEVQRGACAAPLDMWSDSWIGGWPAAADASMFAFYPLRVFCTLGPGFNFFVITAYLAAALGVFLYLRSLELPSAAAWAGSISFALGGFFLSHLGHTSMIHAAAWLPLGLACTESWLKERRARWLLALAVAVAMSLTAGHPQLALYALLVLSGYILWYLPASLATGKATVWIALALAFLAGLALAAYPVMLTVDYVPQTARSALPFGDFAGYSLTVSQLPMLFFPYAFGGFSLSPENVVPYTGDWDFSTVSIYVPFLMLLCSAGGVAFPRRRLGLFWALVAVTALLLGLGPEIEPLARLIYRVPLLNMFRSPARHAFEFTLALSVLGAMGLSELLGRRHSRRFWTLSAACVSALFLLGLASGLGTQSGFLDGDPALAGNLLTQWRIRSLLIPVAVAIAAVVALVMMRAKPRSRLGPSLAVAGILLGAWSFAAHAPWRSTTKPYASTLRPVGIEKTAMRFLRERGGRALNASGGFGSVLDPERSQLFGVSSVNWYGPMLPSRPAKVLTMPTWGGPAAWLFQPFNRALDLYGVRLVVFERSRPGDAGETGRISNSLENRNRWRPIHETGTLSIYENRRALPLAWIVGEWVAVDAAAAAHAIRRGQLPDGTSFSPKKQAIVSGIPHGRVSEFDETSRARAGWRSAGEMVVRTDSSTDGLLVMGVNASPGWRAKVDGRPASWVRADFSLMGLRLDPGSHEVVMRYRPVVSSAWWGAALVPLLLTGWAVRASTRSPRLPADATRRTAG